ncbi:MAG TPA: 5-methyltetrahydropteroyltriglutamate--homocysteine S-methyltransferase [Candidatus Limnocylindria bacterium]|nr:5-methyltetrahydropteroyltriglutamate--homocysteine S-methyltransferase [Candidatus Limnocylindria bacterium]
MDIAAQLLGYPRIGPNRELKWALERRWSDRLDRSGFESRIDELRRAHLDEQRSLIGSATDDFFLYDEVLETALMLGIVPGALAGQLADDPFAVLSALARGSEGREAWEMTKWFDTNYHYVVPEIEAPPGELRPLPWREPVAGDAVWVVLGPYSLVKLSRRADGLDEREIARAAGDALWSWLRRRAAADPGFRVQVDEPCLGLVLDAADRDLLEAAYAGAADLGLREPPLVSVQFGRAAAGTLETLGARGFAVQVALDAVPRLATTDAWRTQPTHVVAVMDGRSVWPDAYDRAREVISALPDDGRPIRIVPSTSLIFLPYTVAGEELPAGFQFAREKAAALAEWARALPDGEPEQVAEPAAAEWPEPGELLPRAPRPERRRAQSDLDLPRYPTTTIGSLPQTGEVRQLRTRRDRGEIDDAAYDREIDALILDGIRWQERVGLDVLVHGEFERTDMVEYFAAQMDGYLTTRNGWVLSYGSRCVRPPILATPPTIRAPMTVREWRVAQSATSKPVKGMLTGPVTIVNWSFRPPGVPDDRLFWAVAQPIAREVEYLVEAGARVIQVDEPAVRERWPLPTEDADEKRAIYARGTRAALNRVFNQPANVQMHTHMCYGTNAEIAPLWSESGVDVSSIWYARSKDDDRIRAFYEILPDGRLEIGPGVFDVHSPFSPGADVMTERLEHFAGYMDPEDIWVNPDCGLKTRRWDEIERQLGDMVAAARERRGSRVAVGAGGDG